MLGGKIKVINEKNSVSIVPFLDHKYLVSFTHGTKSTTVASRTIWLTESKATNAIDQMSHCLSCLIIGLLGSIRCKHVDRWEHLSKIKARLFWPVENIFSLTKAQ